MTDKQKKLPIDKRTKRNWALYNLAKTREKQLFYELLYELAQIIPEPIHENGRPPIPIKDLFFSAGLKLYSNYSGRKISSDLEHAKNMNLISKKPHFNTMHSFLNCPATYSLLKKLLVISALPLKDLEFIFGMDSSGFGAFSQICWRRVRTSDRYNKSRNWKTFMKAHICIGTYSNIIASCEITDAHTGDPTAAPEILNSVGNHFNVKEMTGDKAYSTKRILMIIDEMNATSYIPFKSNSNPNKKSPKIWTQMYNYFNENREEFMEKYHKRSNVETTFAMVKMRLGEFLRCKNFESKRNELMVKLIVHNLTCLITQIFNNDIKIDFRICKESFENKDLRNFDKKVSGQE